MLKLIPNLDAVIVSMQNDWNAIEKQKLENKLHLEGRIVVIKDLKLFCFCCLFFIACLSAASTTSPHSRPRTGVVAQR